MKTGPSIWLLVTAMSLGILVSGCAQFPYRHESKSAASEPADDAGIGDGERFRPPGMKQDTFFFNEKSRDIEKSLGL